MNLWPFHRSEPHVQVRYVAATKRESRELAAAKAAMTAQLRREVTQGKLVRAVEKHRSVDDICLNAVADGLGVML
jgi:hypothetical protein